MEQNYLNKLEKIQPALVPDFMLDGIKKKIEEKRITDKRNGNYALIFAFVLLFANVGILSEYNNKTNTNTANQEVNLYSIETSNFIGYE